MKPNKSPHEKQPALPHSAEAERGVLSSMMQVQDGAVAVHEARSWLDPNHFYVPAHRTIFNALCKMRDEGSAIDLITLTQWLRDAGELAAVGGAAYVTELASFVPTAANVAYYIEIMCEKYILREARCAAELTIQQTSNGLCEPSAVLDELELRIASLRSLGRNGKFPQIEDAAELVAKPSNVPEDVIEGVRHRGAKMVAGGASKSNKTWLFIDLAISVATGTEWLNYPTRKGRALYVNFELPAPFFAKRLQTICDERQLKVKTGMLSVLNLRGHVADWAKLQAQIPSDFYVLIILDPSYKLLLGRDENKAGDIASLMAEFEVLAVRTGAAVAFGAHYSKGNQAQKEAIDRIGGSGVFARDPDTILNFTRHEQADCFTVEATLRNHPPIPPFVVRWEFPLFIVENLLDPAQLKQVGRKPDESLAAAKILELLTEPTSTTAWRKMAADELGASKATFFRRLAELEAAGKVVKGKARKWSQIP